MPNRLTIDMPLFSRRLEEARQHGLASKALQPIETRKTILDDKIPYELRQLSSLRRKSSASSSALKANPFLPYEEDLYIGHLSTGHVVLLNKYNVVYNHFLIVTAEFEAQEELLSKREFMAMGETMPAFPMLMFYNSGKTAGASQPHRHLQGFPIDALPVESVLDRISHIPEQHPDLPYKHLVVNIEKKNISECYSLYLEMLQQLRLWQPGTKQPEPYNLLVTNRWLMIVPRYQEKVNGISINALGFAGLLLVKNEQQLAQMIDGHPANLLQQVSEQPCIDT